MKGKVLFFIVLLLLSMIILPTFSLFLRDVIEVYKFSFIKIPDGYFINAVKDINTYKLFFTVVDPANAISWIALLYILYSQLIGSLNILKIHPKYVQKETYGSHGTSRWQLKNEILNNYYKDKVGWFLGSYKSGESYKLGMDAAYHPLEGQLNMQVTVIGSPGSYKTTGYVLPNVFHIPYAYRNSDIKPDLLITDPKSEIFSLTADYLENQGYEVRVLDFIHLNYMDSINCLDFISTDKEMIEIGEGYVKSVGGTQTVGRGSGDSFWDDAESQLLSALIGYVLQTQPKELRTFTTVAKTLSSDNVSNPRKAYYFFKNAGVTGAALQLWNNFLMAEDRVRANILIGLATKLRLFAISGIQNITSSTSLDISKLGAKKDKPMAVFILLPDGDRTFSPIINVVVSTILKQLYKTAYMYDNSLYAPVYLLLEEMANIGKIMGLTEMLGTMRGRRIYPMMIWQSISQMKQRYPDAWEDVLSMCDTHIYLGINDEFTAKYASNSIGDTTINVQGTSRNFDGVFGVNKKSESSQYMARKLLLPEECKMLSNKKLIISQRSRYPVMLYKVQYKYWEKRHRICNSKSVFDLPLIKSANHHVLFDDIKVNELVDKRLLRQNFKERNPEIEIREIYSERNSADDMEFEADNNLELEKDIELERDFDRGNDVLFTIDDIDSDDYDRD